MVIAACDCGVLLLERVMLLSVLYSLLVFVLWSSSVVTKCLHSSVFCSSSLLSIWVLSVCIWWAMSCVWGLGDVFLSVSRCLIRPSISGVKLGLYIFLQPLGMCFLSAFCMIVLKCCTVVLMFVMGVLFRVSKCCSVSLVNLSQLALL